MNRSYKADDINFNTDTQAVILSVDLGTTMGFAILDGETVECGEITLKKASDKHDGQRYIAFQGQVQAWFKAHDITHVYYEQVISHGRFNSTRTAHVFGGFLAVLQMECLRRSIQPVAVGVGTLKKSATGKGNAKKPQMVAAARSYGFELKDKEDNAADAICLLAHAVRSLGG